MDEPDCDDHGGGLKQARCAGTARFMRIRLITVDGVKRGGVPDNG